VISENIANIDTTRTENGAPYTRKYVVLQEQTGSFSDVLSSSLQGGSSGGGVKVSEIGEDTTQGELVYDPTHPDANANGYVQMPNVDVSQEMVDMISAYRSYEANVTAFSAYKDMAIKTLEIGT
jgi:flagellar basal-body rod protein FlgC